MCSVSLLLGRKGDEKHRGALDDSDSLDHEAVVEDNIHVASDQTIVAWTDCNLRDLHVQSTVTASTRRKTFSGDLASEHIRREGR